MLLIALIITALFVGFILERLFSALPTSKMTRAEQFSRMNEKERHEFDILKNITFVLLAFLILCIIVIIANAFGLKIDSDDMNIIDKAINVAGITMFFVLVRLNIVTPKIKKPDQVGSPKDYKDK